MAGYAHEEKKRNALIIKTNGRRVRSELTLWQETSCQRVLFLVQREKELPVSRYQGEIYLASLTVSPTKGYQSFFISDVCTTQSRIVVVTHLTLIYSGRTISYNPKINK